VYQRHSSLEKHLYSVESTAVSCVDGILFSLPKRYLYVFEKISHGENIDAHDDDDEDSKRRTVSHLQRVPHSYNYSQHNVSGESFIFYDSFYFLLLQIHFVLNMVSFVILFVEVNMKN